jgi:hypothetical protein
MYVYFMRKDILKTTKMLTDVITTKLDRDFNFTVLGSF